MTVAAPIETLRSPWESTFSDLVMSANHDILVLSPYVSRRPIDQLLSILTRRRVHQTVRARLVTDLSPGSLATEMLDIGAVLRLLETVPNATLTHLPRLHAKVYIADHSRAVVTSANMTDGGLSFNHEFGLSLTDPTLVAKVRQDAEAYVSLGGDVSQEALADLKTTADELASLQRKADYSVNSHLRKALKAKSKLAQLQVLRIRAKGKTTHGIFADTLMYLLARGPQRTVHLHSIIQRIHPDLCDDSIERVIDGVHFGKRWKHYVRTAQQHLKRRGMIAHHQGRWYRTDSDGN